MQETRAAEPAPGVGAPRRTAQRSRHSNETRVDVAVDLDGPGAFDVKTDVGFFDHMLEQFAKHGRTDLRVSAVGDLYIDDHHTVEDVGIALGQAIDEALGERRGIRRYASIELPMDEALTRAAIDVSGRPFLVFRSTFRADKIGAFDTQLVEEFFRALATNARITLHLETLYGHNDHHVAESCFKAFARAFAAAKEIDPAAAGEIPSTKGRLRG